MAALKFVTLSNLETFLSKLKENLSGSKLSESGKFVSSITQTDGKVSAEFAQIKASDVHVNDSTTLDSKLTSIESAIEDAIEQAGEDSKIELESAAGSDSVLKVYTLKQNGETIGTIDIPKDFLVKSGTVEGTGSDAKIVLVLNTKDSSDTDGGKVEIPVGSLVDEYTAGNGINVASRVVSVKRDNASEDFLEVTEAGVKVSGIATAISTAVAGETSRATQAEEGLDTRLDAVEEMLGISGDGEGETVADQIESAIEEALEELTAAEVGGEGKFVKSVKQDNGKITATEGSFDDLFVACTTDEINGLFGA